MGRSAAKGEGLQQLMRGIVEAGIAPPPIVGKAASANLTPEEPAGEEELTYKPAYGVWDPSVPHPPFVREYQSNLIRTVESMYMDPRKQCLTIQCPTGGGKTVISTQLIARAKSGTRILYVVPSKEIFKQTEDKLTAAGVQFETLSSGEHPNMLGVNMLLAMSQTLARRKKSTMWSRWRPDIVFIDEIHKLISQHRSVAKRFEAPIIGLTATPCRLDGQDLSDITPFLVVGPQVATLQQAGFLVKDVVFRAPSPALREVRVNKGDYDQAALEQAYLAQEIYKVVPDHWHLRAKGKRTITFCPGVTFSRKLVQAYRSAGIRAEHVDATTQPEHRDAALERLRQHKIDVLCNVGLYVEGLDLVEVECVTMCQTTKSVSRYMQQLGRGLRPAPHIGKDKLIIIDHAGNTPVHGRVSKARDWQHGGWCDPDELEDHQCRFCGALGPFPDKCEECRFGFDSVEYLPPRAEGDGHVIVLGGGTGLRGQALHRAERERSRAVPLRVCPVWARQVRSLWYRLERDRLAHGLPLPSEVSSGYVESRCRRELDDIARELARAG